jgi:hypothetical protein
MTQKVPDEKELLEILELAKIAEQKMREASEMATAMAQKCQSWYEAKQSVKQ